MGNTPDELEQRTARLERAVFGDDDSSEGLSARMKVQELHSGEIRENFRRLNWLLITGIVVGLLNLLISRNPLPATLPSHQSTSVNVGDAAEDITTNSGRTWLTVQEVAKREGITDRTILNYIDARMIEPEPTKHGKEWQISEKYRIVPKNAAATAPGTKPET